jgi:SAM-dependent methyltransferase
MTSGAPSFDERAEWFDAHYGTARGVTRLQLVLERIREMFPPPPARVLDAGGGSGAVAIPLASEGYDVMLLDPSRGMLEIASERMRSTKVDLALTLGSIDDVSTLALGPFDAICCHAVLMYLDDPGTALTTLRSVATPGAALSLLEKNGEALAMRPGLRGDYEEARRLLDARVSTGNLGIPNRARSVSDWSELLARSGWHLDSWVGVRLFSDVAEDELAPGRLDQLVALEREAGRREPYRSLSRLVHLAATATDAPS